MSTHRSTAITIMALIAFLLPDTGITAPAGCLEGSGRVKSESRSIKTFRTITVGGAFDINVVCGQTQQVVVTADDNLLPHIRTVVRDNVLTIDTDRSICTVSALAIAVAVPDLDALIVKEAADITVSAINNSRFRLASQGAADLTLSGKTRLFQAELSDAATLNAAELVAADVHINAVGSVDAVVHARDNLQAAVNGAGTIIYHGNPKNVSRKSSEAGEIVAAESQNNEF